MQQCGWTALVQECNGDRNMSAGLDAWMDSALCTSNIEVAWGAREASLPESCYSSCTNGAFSPVACGLPSKEHQQCPAPAVGTCHCWCAVCKLRSLLRMQ